MSPLLIGCALLAAFTYGAFIWGAFGVFVARGKASYKLDVLKLLAVVAAAVEIWAILRSEAVAPGWVALGVALYLLAAGLFFWSAAIVRRRPQSLAFSPDTPEFIQQAGPYRWIRHPFYTSYLLSYVAGWMLSQQHGLALVVVVMGVVYVDAARIEERKFAQSPLANSYERYRQTTGMFLPRVGGRSMKTEA